VAVPVSGELFLLVRGERLEAGGHKPLLARSAEENWDTSYTESAREHDRVYIERNDRGPGGPIAWTFKKKSNNFGVQGPELIYIPRNITYDTSNEKKKFTKLHVRFDGIYVKDDDGVLKCVACEEQLEGDKFAQTEVMCETEELDGPVKNLAENLGPCKHGRVNAEINAMRKEETAEWCDHYGLLKLACAAAGLAGLGGATAAGGIALGAVLVAGLSLVKK
jgi:hypothetical protein